MGGLVRTLLALLLLPLPWAVAGQPSLIAVDEGGAAGRVGAPVSLALDLATVFDGKVEPDRLQIVELNTRPYPTLNGC